MSKETSEQPVWTLNHGCWKGTITSRDAAYPEEFGSREEAIKQLNEYKSFYRRIGYSIWFAELTAPDGRKEKL